MQILKIKKKKQSMPMSHYRSLRILSRILSYHLYSIIIYNHGL